MACDTPTRVESDPLPLAAELSAMVAAMHHPKEDRYEDTGALLQLASVARKKGVTVNVVAPGEFAHIAALDGAIEQSGHGKGWLERPNLSPQDMAEGIAFLCSESGRFLSGCVLDYRGI